MYTLLKKTLFSKDFYILDYKRVTRIRVLLYTIFVCTVFSIVITPSYSYFTYKTFNHLKSEINKIPPALYINIKEGKLDANFTKPLVINLSENSKMIVDPKNSFQKYEKNVGYLLLRERGFISIYNNNLTSKNYNEFVNLGVSSKQLINFVNDINLVIVIFYSLFFIFIVNFISFFLNILVMSVVVGTFTYLIGRVFENHPLTYFLRCKILLFLSPYYLLGLLLELVFAQSVVSLPFMFLMIAYFAMVLRK